MKYMFIYHYFKYVVCCFICSLTHFHDNQVNSSLKTSQFYKNFARQAAMFDLDHLDNATQRRMLKSIGNIGIAALKDESKLKQVCWSV